MWLLKGDSGNVIYLKPKKILTVGRNKGDIVLSDDGSISRLHAKIAVEPLKDIGDIQDNAVPLSTLKIEDANSKYGNFILKDDEEIPITEEGYSPRHMDRIRFGLQNYIFTVIYVPIITATSGMKDDEKKKLMEIIDAIDGKIIYAWTSMCTHMTVGTPTISEKFSCALAACTPIVTIDYWKAVLKAFENNEEFPEPNDFVTAINNKMINVGRVCVKPNPLRKSCFKNLTFVHFSSKQYGVYKRMIRLAGGTSIKCGKEKIDMNVCADNVIIVQLVESNTTQATGTGDVNYATACEQLGRCKRRTIPECEIALAILNSSTEKYCNPMYDYAELFRNRNSQAPEDNSKILAMDTQDTDIPTTSSRRPAENRIIAETVDESAEFQFQAPKSIQKDFAVSESVASSSYNSDSIGSIKLASLNHEKYFEEELKKESTSSSRVQSNIVKETAEESREFDLNPSRNMYTKSKSLSESSYNSDSIGSMKLASLNHEKYLEEEFNKGPMTSSTQKSQTESHIVKETIDDYGQSDSQSFKHTHSDPSNSASKRIASCSYNDSVGSTKRDREEDVAIDTAMKKVRLADDRPRKQSLWNKLQESCTDWLSGDDDLSEEKIDTIPEIKEKNPDTINNPTVARKKDADRDFDIDDEWALPKPKSKAPSPRVDVSESEEKTLLAKGDDSTSRKRKVGRSDCSPSRQVTENPRKRNKFSFNNEKEVPQSSRQKGVVALSKRSPQIDSDKEVWQESKKYQSEDDLNSSSDTRNKYDYGEVSIYFQRPDDPNKSSQRLLRITSTDELDESAVSILGKCFRKRHTNIPRRIEFYDISEDSTWSTGSDEEKNSSFDDKDVPTTHKVSSTSIIKRKKTLRV